MGTREIITDKELAKVFEGTNFGYRRPRDVIRNAVFKTMCGYWNGNTSHNIIKHLGLITPKDNISKKGMDYLYEANKEMQIEVDSIRYNQ